MEINFFPRKKSHLSRRNHICGVQNFLCNVNASPLYVFFSELRPPGPTGALSEPQWTPEISQRGSGARRTPTAGSEKKEVEF